MGRVVYVAAAAAVVVMAFVVSAWHRQVMTKVDQVEMRVAQVEVSLSASSGWRGEIMDRLRRVEQCACGQHEVGTAVPVKRWDP